jgi:hypothetical protein
MKNDKTLCELCAMFPELKRAQMRRVLRVLAAALGGPAKVAGAADDASPSAGRQEQTTKYAEAAVVLDAASSLACALALIKKREAP